MHNREHWRAIAHTALSCGMLLLFALMLIFSAHHRLGMPDKAHETLVPTSERTTCDDRTTHTVETALCREKYKSEPRGT